LKIGVQPASTNLGLRSTAPPAYLAAGTREIFILLGGRHAHRRLKSELSIRPIGHQLEHRADAHVLIAFLAYSLQVTLKNRLRMHAPGLTPAAVFEKLATIQMVEVWLPMVDGRWLVMPRHTQPEPDVQALLNQIRITLPSQPPPRIKASQITSK